MDDGVFGVAPKVREAFCATSGTVLAAEVMKRASRHISPSQHSVSDVCLTVLARCLAALIVLLIHPEPATASIVVCRQKGISELRSNLHLVNGLRNWSAFVNSDISFRV